MDSLENKVVWLTTGLVMLLVVALLWPLAFISFFPDKVRSLMDDGEPPAARSQQDRVRSAAPSAAPKGVADVAIGAVNKPATTAPSVVPPSVTKGSAKVAPATAAAQTESVAEDAMPARLLIPGRAAGEKTAAVTHGGPKILTVSPDEWAPTRRPQSY